MRRYVIIGLVILAPLSIASSTNPWPLYDQQANRALQALNQCALSSECREPIRLSNTIICFTHTVITEAEPGILTAARQALVAELKRQTPSVTRVTIYVRIVNSYTVLLERGLRKEGLQPNCTGPGRLASPETIS